MDSTRYWIERYANGGNSGAGSSGNLNIFKSEYLNSIIQKYRIESVLDFGCGQGAILEFLDVNKYLGFDPSPEVIKFLRQEYATDSTKEFQYNTETLESKELVISFDVIFHLIEDAVYENYMKSMFSFSTKYVLIYSSNTNRTDLEYATAPHVKHRIFQKDIPREFSLLEQHQNLFPYSSDNPEQTSWSDFYLYVKNG
jgi:2-polyprenyl-3-methyl-5-hydroxy-6-metoxy-1,4-benzoquinol methylase